MNSYPFFAIKGRPLTVDINEKFKNGNGSEKVIGIYSECNGDGKQWSICLKDNSIVLQDVNDRNNKFKEFLNVIDNGCDDSDGKLIDDTIFISCFYDEHYNYKILNLLTDKITTSRNYNYGRAFPISNQVIIEWSRIQLPSQKPGIMIELIKVDAFNFVTGIGEFICAFEPLPNELFLQISTSIDYSRLLVLSRLSSDYHFSVRSIDSIEKNGDDILQVWNFGNTIHSVTIKEPHVIVHTDLDILIYNIKQDSSWFIKFEQPVEKGFVTSFKNVLIHWNKHMISGESFLYLNFFDIVSGDSIKSIKVDQKYSKTIPPISISPIGNDQDNYSKLLILHKDKEIHQLDFTSQHPTI